MRGAEILPAPIGFWRIALLDFAPNPAAYLSRGNRPVAGATPLQGAHAQLPEFCATVNGFPTAYTLRVWICDPLAGSAESARLPMATDKYAFAPTSLIVAVDGPTLRVLLLLATYADFKTGEGARPKIETLAERLGCTRNTVKRALKIGVDSGLLSKVIRKRPDGVNNPSVYTCNWVINSIGQNSARQQATDCPPVGQQNGHDHAPSSSSSENHARDIYAPKDLTREDFKTERSYEEARQSAQLIVDGWNTICPDLQPAYMPTLFIPGLFHDCRKRWNMKELGLIFSKARDSTYCATDGGTTILHALRYADRFFAGNYDDRNTDA